MVNKSTLLKGLLTVLKDSGWYVAYITCAILLKIVYSTAVSPHLSESFQVEMGRLVSAVVIIYLTCLIHKIVNRLVEWYKVNVMEVTETEVDDMLMPLVKRLLSFVIWLLAAIIILPLYGVNINALVATLGVGSLAIALAAKDTISNIIAGVLIMVDRPFRLGDKVKLPTGEVVIVKDIGLRRSHFLCQTEEIPTIVILPNVDLNSKKIVNYTYGEGYKSTDVCPTSGHIGGVH
jgi:small-conductance mechanosensitive channel